jgi:gluconolactonase
MAFDASGRLYCAHFGAGRVDLFAPDGTRIDEIPMPGMKPTNCCFGGPNNSTLYVTEVETGSVYKIDLGAPGLPLHDGRTAG